MSDIFVSYAREDRPRVEPLVEALERQGWNVWWDREIAPGENFDELIDKEIAASRIVVAVWTENSIHSRWVRSEALEGMDRDVLVPVQLDDVRIPVAFRQVQSAQMFGWPRKIDEDALRQFVEAINAKLSVERTKPYVGPSPRNRVRRFALGGAVALFALIATLALMLATEPPALPDDSLAVLRFQASEPSQQFLADGLAEEVRRSLLNGGPFSLAGQAAAWNAPADIGPEALGTRLNARYLLAGKVDGLGPDLDIAVTLVDSRGDAEMTTLRYQARTDKFEQLDVSIARDVAAALGVNAAFMEQSRDAAAYSLYLRAQDLLRRPAQIETLEQARALLDESIEKDPDMSVAFAALCRTFIKLYETRGAVNDFEDAERFCHRALTLDVEEAEAYLALGRLYQQSGQHRKAIDEFNAAISVDPMLGDAFIGLGESLAATGEAAQAESVLKQGAAAQPGYWRNFNALGLFYMHRGRFPEAVESLTRVTYLMPGTSTGFNNLGAARFYSGDFQASVRDWLRAAELEPSPGARSNIGSAYFLLRRFDEAAQMYEEAIALAPDDHRLWGNFGDALRFSQARTSEAEAAYRRQVELGEDNLRINQNDDILASKLAISHAYLGARERATELLADSLASSPNDPNVLYQAAVARTILGQHDEALDSLTRSIERGYLVEHVRSDAQFDLLRHEPAFDALIR